MPEQALGVIPLGLGFVIEPSELSCKEGKMITNFVFPHNVGYCLCGSAERRGKENPVWLPSPHPASLHQRRLRPGEQRVRRELLLSWTYPERVLLPRHGRSRGSHRYCCEDFRDWLHPATSDQGHGGTHGEL